MSCFSEKLRTFSAELRELSCFAGCDFVWHFSENDRLADILPEQCAHRHAYCRAVKTGAGGGLKACILFHHDECFRKLARNPEPALFECHASVVLLAVPMLVAGTLSGVLFAGPFAGSSGRPAAGLKSELFRTLPGYSARRLLELGKYLKLRMENLFAAEALPANAASRLQTQIAFSDPRIGQVLHYMRGHSAEALSVREAAEKCALSTSRFLHLFRQETGYTFSDWLQRLRVAEARRLLSDTDFKLAVVAAISGIRDQSRMTALFRRYLGVTPGACRKRATGQRKFF